MTATLRAKVFDLPPAGHTVPSPGFTLVEVVATMGIVVVLLTLCSLTLNRAYEVHSTSLRSFRQLEQLNSWGERFRSDAHRAVAIELDSVAARLVMADGGTVHYSVEDGHMLRLIRRDMVVVTHESLVVGQAAQVTWTHDQLGRVPLLSCELRCDAAESNQPPVMWRARLRSLNQPLASPSP